MSEFAAIKNAPIDTSKMDLDVSKPAQPHGLSPVNDPGSIPTLDGWIENLMSCKQLAEIDVSRLCDRVRMRNILEKGMLEPLRSLLLTWGMM